MQNKTHDHVKRCQICSHPELETILSYGHLPIVQNYLTKDQLHEPEITYPLNFCFCPNCGLAQLDCVIDPKLVFPLNYPYRTGLTNMLIRNFRELADKIEKNFSLKPGDLVIDIGSNDGSLLQGFKDKGSRVLGVEPTNAALDAAEGGIPTVQAFFNEEVAEDILEKHGQAKIITMTNAFAHVDDVFGLIRGIARLLSNDGVYISESQYLLNMMANLELDTIYHEHLRFYSLKPLKKLFGSCGFSLIDAEPISAAGGSIRVYAKKGIDSASARVNELISQEETAGLYDVDALRQYGQKMIDAKNELLSLLIKCKQDGARIAALGSPARANTLLGFVKINDQLIDYACEKSGSPKIGLFTPGTHIPVVDEKRLFSDQPEYALVLSWHIGEEIMRLMRKLGYKGKFIMPLPEPKIVEDI